MVVVVVQIVVVEARLSLHLTRRHERS
jgi:hypothetical protein